MKLIRSIIRLTLILKIHCSIYFLSEFPNKQKYLLKTICPSGRLLVCTKLENRRKNFHEFWRTFLLVLQPLKL